jgi:curved DNA-binding protein CbpA
MMELVDFYRILQVDPRAEPEVVRAAYRSLARKYHPDVVGGSAERMVAINQAWDVLGDQRSRKAYDKGRSVLPSKPAEPAPRPAAPVWAEGTPRPRGPVSGTVLDFGRYAGWSFGQLINHDPDFLQWLARAPIGRAYRTEIEALFASRAQPAPAPAGSSPRSRFRHR